MNLKELQIRADEVDLGDLLEIEGQGYWRITGWFVDGNGRFCIEAAGSWHRYHGGQKVNVKRQACPGCSGRGWHHEQAQGPNEVMHGEIPCLACGGSGVMPA